MMRTRLALGRLPLILALVLLVSGCSGGERALSPQAMLLQARAAYLAGDYFGSERMYEDFLKAAMSGASTVDRAFREEAFSRLALIADFARGDKNRAVEVLEAAVAEFAMDQGKQVVFLTELAAFLESIRQPAKAQEAYSRLVALDALSPAEQARGYLGLARTARALNKLPQAEEALAKCLELETSGDTAAACLAESALIAAISQHFDAAAKGLERLAVSSEVESASRVEALFALADVYDIADRRPEAGRIYRELQTGYPNKPALAVRLEAAAKPAPQ